MAAPAIPLVGLPSLTNIWCNAESMAVFRERAAQPGTLIMQQHLRQSDSDNISLLNNDERFSCRDSMQARFGLDGEPQLCVDLQTGRIAIMKLVNGNRCLGQTSPYIVWRGAEVFDLFEMRNLGMAIFGGLVQPINGLEIYRDGYPILAPADGEGEGEGEGEGDGDGDGEGEGDGNGAGAGAGASWRWRDDDHGAVPFY